MSWQQETAAAPTYVIQLAALTCPEIVEALQGKDWVKC